MQEESESTSDGERASRGRGRASCKWSHDPEDVGLNNSRARLLTAAEAVPFAVQACRVPYRDPGALH